MSALLGKPLPPSSSNHASKPRPTDPQSTRFPTSRPPRPCTHLALGVAEDDCLCDGEGVVQVAQRVKLPLLALHSHKELLDALQRGGGGGGVDRGGRAGGARDEEMAAEAGSQLSTGFTPQPLPTHSATSMHHWAGSARTSSVSSSRLTKALGSPPTQPSPPPHTTVTLPTSQAAHPPPGSAHLASPGCALGLS